MSSLSTPRSLEYWLQKIESVHHREIDMGLERVRDVLERMGLSMPDYPVILVGGTNGKGSCVAFLHSMLSEQGYRVGAYTSPHLVRYNERIRLADRLAGDEELVAAFKAIDQARGDVPLTYFEFGTLAAVKLFRDKAMDVAVMEVGMGGRLDAVNALEPLGVLLTNVGLDHQTWLGETREQIGREKAGIFRQGVPAVCADPAVPESVLSAARQTGADLALVNRDYTWRIEGDRWSWQFGDQSVTFPAPALHGKFQVGNAAAVITLLSMIEQPLPVSRQAMEHGLTRVSLPGRLQIINESPLRMTDVAHNTESVSELAAYLRDLDHDGKIIAVCGMLRDKPVEKVLALMADEVDEWHFGSIHDKRGAMARELAAALSRVAPQALAISHDSVKAAWQAATAAQKADDIVIAFGSFYSVGDIISLY
ncbi:MAG: bifunctional tetrahydrofolate synthase/dihydrofolate synthase [Gammaproteobacteria bacterium]|nr:MAG: bifunctional tetrahydrofolate synthase/dihydrofolate synthase [Gammaproteobacteria bacterium]